jgi:hypothetical protein
MPSAQPSKIKEVNPVTSMLKTARTVVGVGTAPANPIDNATYHPEERTMDITECPLYLHHPTMETTDQSHTIPMAHLLLIIEEVEVDTIVTMTDMTDMTIAIIGVEVEVPTRTDTKKDQVVG